MDEEKRDKKVEKDDESFEPPKVLDRGKIEARLFSDEPDPWGP